MAKWKIDSRTVPYCCGFAEAGNFRESEYGREPKQAIDFELDVRPGCPLLFNFYRPIEWNGDNEITGEAENYEAEELRQEVIKHPDAKHLATFINPNSGNRVDSWMIFTGEISYEKD